MIKDALKVSGIVYLNTMFCIGCKFGHRMAPLELLPNLVTRLRHLNYFQIWSPDRAICISSKFGHQMAPCNNSKFGHQMAPLELVPKGWLQTVKLRPLVDIKLARPIRSQYFRFSINKPQDQSFFFLVQKHHV